MSRRPRICFLGLENLPILAPEFAEHTIGGEQVQHSLLAKLLARRGYDASMVVYDYGQEDRGRWEQVTTYKAYRQDAGIPVVRFIYPRFTGIWQALRRADADVYYVSCAGMHVGLTALFCRMHRRRVVFRVAHDTDCDPDALLVTYWRDRKLYEYGLRHADAILVQSESQQQAMLSNYGLRSAIAGMLVDQPKQIPELEDRPGDVLWVNNIRAFKRPGLLLELAERMPHLRFNMIGGPQPGHESLFDDIRQSADRMENLQFHGQIPYHEMDVRYGASRVFVNTSDSEGFPNAFLQAWIRGTPVVSFFDPDGVICRQGLGRAVKSLDEMAAAIDELAADRTAWRAASRRCRAYMERAYRDDLILTPYLQLFGQAA